MAEANCNSSSMEQRQRQQRQQQLYLEEHRRKLFLMQQQLQQQQQPQASIHHQPSYNCHQPLQRIIPHFLPYNLRSSGVGPFKAPPPHQPPPSSSSSPRPPPVPGLLPHDVRPHFQPARPAASRVEVGVGSKRTVNPVEIDMAHQDALMVSNPDYNSPFASVEDAVHRLLPYHVVSDYAEEDDRVLESDTTGGIKSRYQKWDNDVLGTVTKFNAAFEKQVGNFNKMLLKRAQGEFRSEERLMLEKALMQEEMEAFLKTKAEMESREKADKEAAEAQMRMAMAQGEQAQANVYAASLRSGGSGEQGGGNMDGLHRWNYSKRDEEPSEDSSE